MSRLQTCKRSMTSSSSRWTTLPNCKTHCNYNIRKSKISKWKIQTWNLSFWANERASYPWKAFAISSRKWTIKYKKSTSNKWPTISWLNYKLSRYRIWDLWTKWWDNHSRWECSDCFHRRPSKPTCSKSQFCRSVNSKTPSNKCYP